MHWSVIVCTRNRAHNLINAVERLSSLDYAANLFEIIIVDNASTDKTDEVSSSLKSDVSNLVYVREDLIGLSHARNRGISVAEGDFIAFIDDDAWPERGWLKNLENGFIDPHVAAIGGNVLPFFEYAGGWPEWLHDRLHGFFTVVDYGDRKRLHYPNYPAGTNMAFRRVILEQIGQFDHYLGRIGENLLSGEETDLCLRIETAGYDIAYAPDAVVHHKVHEDRLTRDWVKQRSHWQGVTAALIEKGHFSKKYRYLKALKYLIFIVAGKLGHLFYSLTGNEKSAFFCSCQVILCQAYVKTIGE